MKRILFIISIVQISLYVLPFSLTNLANAQDPSTFLSQPKKIAVDSKDNVYVLHTYGIARISPDGKFTPIADRAFSDIAIDSKDQLYLSQSSTIWKMNSATKSIEFFAGDQNYGGATDGNLLDAKFNKIQSLFIDQNDVIYVADAASKFLKEIDPKAGKTWIEPNVPAKYKQLDYWYCVRQIKQGKVTTLKTADNKLLLLNNLTGMVADKDGNIIYAGGGFSRAIRKLDVSKSTWSTLAGKPFKRDWCPVYITGDTSKAELYDPGFMLLDKSGDMLYLDNRLHRIVKISKGKVSTVAGSGIIEPCRQNIGGLAREGYKDGKAGTALFNFPTSMAYDSKGNLYIADSKNSCVRKLSPDGMVSTVTHFNRSKALINNY